MHVGNPQALWLLTLLAPLVLAALWSARRRRRAAARLGETALLGRLYEPAVRSWRRRRALAGLAAAALLAVAAARPQYGRVEQTLERAGLDVIIGIDVSASMLATDIEPNRLAQAKESLKRLVRSLRGHRLGIVAFAGEAFLLCPMTLDHALALLVLESVGPDSVGVPGTDLGRAVEVAQGAFQRGGAGSPVLVLITDGEDNEGRGLAAAQRAAGAGVRIFAIGIGTERGGPVPEGERGYKEKDGAKVVSHLDLAGLAAMARATGGAAYAGGANPGVAVNAIALRLDRMDKTELESGKIVLYEDRYGWFVAPAIILLVWLAAFGPGGRVSARGAAELTPAAHVA